MQSTAAVEVGDVDSLARQFVTDDPWHYDVREAVEKSREVVKGRGCRNVAHFLCSLALNDQPTIHLHTLIIVPSGSQYSTVSYSAFSPLYGVVRWGEDGLALSWEELLKEEEEEKGSLERCMHAIGSLCHTTLRELQLLGLAISPKHLNSLFQAMHELLPISDHSPMSTSYSTQADQLMISSAHLNIHNDSAALDLITARDPTYKSPGYSLQCLRLWNLHNYVDEGTAESGELQALLTLPPSLLFLSFDDDHRRYAPPIQLAPPPAPRLVEALVEQAVNAGMPITSPAEPAQGGLLQEAGEVIAHQSSMTPFYTLSSLLCCPHLNLQGLSIFCSKIENGRLIPSEDDLRKAALSLAHNTCLKALSIYVDSKPLLPEQFATEGLKLNTSLTTLHLQNFRMPEPSGFDLFFEEGIAHNQSLTQLSLEGCEGPWTVESILDSLQDNGSLHDIDLRGTPLEGDAAVGAALERNRRRAESMRRVGVNPRKVQPSVARVFLCGEPYAGKTTIVKSLNKLSKSTLKKCLDKDWLLYNIFGRERPRTKGIEVTSLKRDGVKIVFWDMAGQEEYRCFHDYVFPDLSSRQSPSLFLFVYSPICPTTQNIKTTDMFHKELEYWLKFITSKTLRSKKFIPTLIIALTRKDRVPNVKVQLQQEIASLQKKFEKFVAFGAPNVFEVNSRDPFSLGELHKQLFDMSSHILKLVKPVLELNEKISTLFEKKLSKGEISPIITKEKYIDICEQELGKGIYEIADSVAGLLNESGDFIYSGSHNFVVVDTRWFCHAIMGNLIYYTGPSNGVIGRPGFFEKEYLQSLLEKEIILPNGGVKGFFHFFLKRNANMETARVSGETLLQVLKELNVVCEVLGTSTIFLPSSLRSQEDTLSTKAQIISSQDIKGRFQLGRRLQCEDLEHTFLTPGVFPGLQVTFANKFEERVKLERNYINLTHQNGVDVVIELCASEGDDPAIDILVKSPRSLTYNVEWTKLNVVMDIIKICASKKGIQGVHLVQSVIGPSQSILLKTKKRQNVLVKYLQDQLEKEFLSNGDVNEAIYSWLDEKNTPLAKDQIANLLSTMEIQEVCERYGKKLKEAVNVMTTDLNPFLKKTRHEENSLIYISENINLGGLENVLKEILHKINEMKDEHHNDMILINNELVRINKGLSNLQKEVYDRLVDMQELISQMEEKKLPTMWLLSIDHLKVIAKVVPSFHRAHLKLLCEHKRHPHLPKEQAGISFNYLEDKSFLQKALPYMQVFLKLAYIATKVSAHLIGGVGSLIPDFSQVTSLVEDWNFPMPALPKLESSSNIPQDYASSSIQQFRQEYQQSARLWVWQFLKEHNCIEDLEISNLFKLKRVRYKVDGRIGWLCATHCSEGVACGDLYMP